jgi:hypothetical protein
MADKSELEKLKNEFEGSAAQRAGLTFNDFVKLVQATPAKTAKQKVTVSRGSNKAKQVGDMNQRESYNSVRGQSAKTISGGTVYTSKESKVSAKKNKGAMAEYKQQRSGGKGK